MSTPHTVETTTTTMDMEEVMVEAGLGVGARCGEEALHGQRARDGGEQVVSA